MTPSKLVLIPLAAAALALPSIASAADVPPAPTAEPGVVLRLGPTGPAGWISPARFNTIETLDFGRETTGTTSSARRILLVNDTGARIRAPWLLIRESAGTGVKEPHHSEFRVVEDRCRSGQSSGKGGLGLTLGVMLDPGAACAVRVVFSPGGEGDRGGFADSPLLKAGQDFFHGTVHLVGEGVRQTSEPAVDFGVHAVAAATVSRDITYRNSAPRTIRMRKTELDGDDADAFRVVGDECQNRLLARDEQCKVSVTFTPSVAGAKQARVLFRDWDGEAPEESVMLAGTATS